MRKSIIALSCFVLTLLLALSMTYAAKADINNSMWLEPTFQGTDNFHAASVIAYTEGAMAKLVVFVDRDLSGVSSINVTAVSVVFDWGGNYTVTVSPAFTIDATAPQAAFTVTFTVPSIATASNMLLHGFDVYVKYASTLGPGTFISSGGSFAVYSATQAEAQTTGQTADAYNQPFPPFNSPEANILWEKGDAENSRGDTAYTLGNFGAARTHYQNAVTLYEQAYTAEIIYTQDSREADTAWRNAQTDYYSALADSNVAQANATMKQADAFVAQAAAATTEAEAAMRQADAALTNAYGWMAIGIGWILIGVGAIVYGMRRPKIAAA